MTLDDLITSLTDLRNRQPQLADKEVLVSDSDDLMESIETIDYDHYEGAVIYITGSIAPF